MLACWSDLFIEALWPLLFLWAVSKRQQVSLAMDMEDRREAGTRANEDREGVQVLWLGEPATRSIRRHCPHDARCTMIELIIGTYGVLCWLLFRSASFRSIPIPWRPRSRSSVALRLGVNGLGLLIRYQSPASADGRLYVVATPIVPQVVAGDHVPSANVPLRRATFSFDRPSPWSVRGGSP